MGTARKLIRQDRILPDETTVLCITGNGLKTTDVLAGKYQAEIPIAPRLREFEAFLQSKLDGIDAPSFAGGTPALPETFAGQKPVLPAAGETPVVPVEA